MRKTIPCLVLALCAPALAAQEARVVFDLRGEVAGLGSVSSTHTSFTANTVGAVMDDGTWLATISVQSYGTVVLADGVPIIGPGDVLPGGQVVVSPYLQGVDDGSLALIIVGTQNAGTVLVSYDGAVLTEVLANGATLTNVDGVADGSTLLGIQSGELHSNGSLTIRGAINTVPGSAIVHVVPDGNGDIDGGSLHAHIGGAPPAGGGNSINFIERYAGNGDGDYFFSANSQPGSRKFVYYNDTVFARHLDSTPGGTISNPYKLSRFDISPSGATAFGCTTYASSGPLGGLVRWNGADFAWHGQNVPGIGVLDHVRYENVRLLHGDLITWVHEDQNAPAHANGSLYYQHTPVLTEGTFRIRDRFGKDILGHEIASSRSGRYLLADIELHPGRGLVWFDLLGSPEAPCAQEPDAFAPNHTCATASQLGGIGSDVELRELISEDGAPDFFRFTIFPEEEVQISLSSDFESADLDLYLYDDACTPLAVNTDASDDPGLLWQNPTMQTVEVVLEVRVAATSSHPCGVYDLNLEPAATLVCQPQYTEDGFEDNDAFADGFPLHAGQYDDLYVSIDDEDWFAIRVPPFATVQIDLTQDADTFPDSSYMCGILMWTANNYLDPFEHTLGSPGASWTWTNDNPNLWDDELVPETVTGVMRIFMYANGSSTACTFYELDISLTPASPFETYCTPAAPHSGGVTGHLYATGSSEVAANDLELTASNLPPNQFGYFLVAPAQAEVPNVAGSQGTLCLGGPIGRFNAFTQSSGASGTISVAPDLTGIPTPGQPHAVQPGETWNFQAWFRDFNPTPTSNMTDALEVTFF